ncbi:probable 3',5'-cyclic phosphodiesterase pde-5 isoform X2 [Lytechinus variegatus]|uniref:probable 3',5'-cyclic phosphodiesterase pde-5 isoform X2 n=1 Tax=Lytechinus variegatus TaxID=7654 RepID=UPI001BB0EACB|nr:probable 3',5'-cyclic phosphodiesterase pde-5 isoform X2 [Lytechinus variegatus]
MSLTKRTARGNPSDSKHKRHYPFLAHSSRHPSNAYYTPLQGAGDLRFYPPPGSTNPTQLRQHHHPTKNKMSNASRQVGNRRLPPLPAPGQNRRNQPTSPHGAGKSSVGGSSTYHGSQTSSARSRGGSSTSSYSGVRVSVSYDMIVKGLSTYGNGYAKNNNRISQSQATSDQIGHIPENIVQEHIRHYLDENPQFLEDYILNHTSAEQVEKWLNSIRRKPAPRSAGRSPGHQTQALKRPLLQSSTSTIGIPGPHNSKLEGTFTGETIRASHANARQWKSSAFQERRKQMYDLAIDIQTYNHRLGLINELAICIEERIHADGYTLYAVTGNGSELFEYKGNEKSEPGQRPTWAVAKGQTISGYVAYSGQVVNTKDPTGNELHPHGVAAQSVTAHAVLALPVIELTDELSGSECEHHNQVAGVLEFYRSDAKAFSTEDEMHADSYLLWGTLTVHYAQFGNDKDFDKKLYVDMIRQRKQNDFLLAVTKSIFTDIVSMDSVIMKIMNFAQKLVNADRASLFLVDSKKNELYARIFDIGNGLGNPMDDKDQKEIRFSMAKGVAGHVASTGDILNIPDAYQDERFNREVDLQTGYVTKTILCMPIYIRGNVIGVVQMVNKKNGLFTRADEQAFETFAVYCGLALHHAKLYDKIRRSEQKHKVALEVLSYHAMCMDNEFKGLRNMPLPDPMPDIARYDFSPWGLEEEAKPLYVLCMFKDMFDLNNPPPGHPDHQQRFDYDELCRFILTVRKNYRRVPYHNWTHAFSVAHSVYTMIKTGNGQVFNPLEALALFVACLCHDLDHRGKNNAFMVNTASPLASVYSTSTMEHHHFNMTITILQNDGHNIFKHLSSEEYKQVLGDIRHAILATDLALFFPNKAKLKKIVEEKKFSWDNQEHRSLCRAIAMTACDLVAVVKPFDLQQKVALEIFEEFYQQGDEEKAAGRNPIPMMDRDRAHELPANQVSFIVGICLPCYDLLAQLVPSAKPMYDGAAKNLQNWSALVAKQKSEEEEKKELEGKNDGDNKKEEKKPDKAPPAKPPPSRTTSKIPKEVLDSDDGLE